MLFNCDYNSDYTSNCREKNSNRNRNPNCQKKFDFNCNCNRNRIEKWTIIHLWINY